MEYKVIKKVNIEEDNIDYVKEFLKARGVNENKIDSFFNLGFDVVNSPFNLDNLQQGIDMLNKHIINNSKIAIIVDCDFDGFSSSALLTNYINFVRSSNCSWQNSQSEIVHLFHEDKAHGLDDITIMRRIRDEVKPQLLIIPDASGNQEQYNALVELGIEILVLDHHDTECKGDNDKVVVINNQHSQNYTNKDFSGVGIVWQFCRGIDEFLNIDIADRWLDLVALGNIGDVMNLQSDETRWVIMNGFTADYLNSNFLHFFQMTNFQMKDRDYNPFTVAFYVVPMFNAVCRIGDEKEKQLLFSSLLDCNSEIMVADGTRGHTGDVPLVQEAIRVASNAKGRQDRRKNKLCELIEQVIRDEHLTQHKVLILAFDDGKDEYRSLAGVAASKLAEQYNRPVILAFKVKDDKSEYYRGSLRVPDAGVPEYENFRTQCVDSGLVIYASGHAKAAGIAFLPDKIDLLNEYFDKKYANLSADTFYNVDFEFDADDPKITDAITKFYNLKNIYGQGLKEPVIAIKNVKVGNNVSLVGKLKNTLWISTKYFKLINFKSSQEEFDSLKLPMVDDCEQYYLGTFICTASDVNCWNGQVSFQMQIIDYNLDTVKYNF